MTTALRNATWTVIALAAAAAAAPAADKGIHITSGKTVSFTWYLNDGAGFRWDISSNGQVSDGTNDAYDGGMQLRIGGTYFSSSSQGKLGPDGREVEIGPWRHNNLQIYRRIYIDAKMGYCRWIDIFENVTDATQNITVQYYSNLGLSVTSVVTTSGKNTLTSKDWGIVTAGSDSSSRPDVIHVFGTKSSKVRPNFRYTQNNDSVYQDYTLKIPARKTQAICIFQAQRRPTSQAVKFLKEFNPRRELSKIPTPLRKILVNMGGATLVLGGLDLPRHEEHDMAVLRNENELLGAILNERFDVETFYGKLQLPADDVVGLNVPAPDDPHVQVVLLNGQIVAGKLLNAPLRIRLTNGNEMALPPSKLTAATFAMGPERPEEVKINRPTVVLRSGQQLSFDMDDLDCTFQCQYGTFQLDPNDLHGIRFDTPEGGLHRAVFRNGSVLSGLMRTERFKLQLDLGPTLDVPRHLASQLLFPAEPIDTADLCELTLRNEDQLFGRIADESLTVTTQFGRITVKPEEISDIQIPEEGGLGEVLIKLHNGTTVTGELVGETIRFQLVAGPELQIFLGHLVQMTCPKPPTPPASPAPETQPAPKENTPDPEEPTPPPADLTPPEAPVIRLRAAEPVPEPKPTKTPARNARRSEVKAAPPNDKARAEIAALRASIEKMRRREDQLKKEAEKTNQPEMRAKIAAELAASAKKIKELEALIAAREKAALIQTQEEKTLIKAREKEAASRSKIRH